MSKADWKRSNESSCGGKKAFLTWKQAQTHNNHMGRFGSPLIAKGKKFDKLEPYKCFNCQLVHLGHPPRRRHPHRSRFAQEASSQEDFQT